MSEQTNDPDLKNFIKLQILTKVGCVILHNKFIKLHSQKSKNGSKCESFFFFRRYIYEKAGRLQRMFLEAGNIRRLNITTLCQLLQDILTNELEHDMLKEIAQVQNTLANHATLEINNDEFEFHWKRLSNALEFFGLQDDRLEKLHAAETLYGLYLPDLKCCKSKSTDKALLLKKEADSFFRSHNYLKSICLYSEAIELPDLSDQILVFLYVNRSMAYIKLSDTDDFIQNAKDDAKISISCEPSWWKTYYTLGRVYQAKSNYEKAILAYNKALTTDSSQYIVRSARDQCREKIAIMHSEECFDAQTTQRSLDECSQNNVPGSDKSDMTNKIDESVQTVQNMDSSSYDANVILATVNQIGSSFPTSYEEAVRLYTVVLKDIPKAISLPAKFSDSDPKMSVAETQFLLGNSYENRVGVNLDPVNARCRYEKSLENGIFRAANMLGWIYASGEGVLPNIERAVEYWKIAADKGCVESMETLEDYYLRILDHQEAKKWWQLALDNGSITAAERKQMHEKNAVDGGFQLSELGSGWDEVKSVLDDLALKSYSRSSGGSRVAFNAFKNVGNIFSYAMEGSVTARKLLSSVDHFIKGNKFMISNKELDKLKMIYHFAGAFRQNYLVPFWKPEEREALQSLIELQLNSSSSEYNPNSFELDLRICYVSIIVGTTEDLLEILQFSIKRFPDEYYFYDFEQILLGSLGRYSEGLEKANQSLEKFPNCVPLLYNKAYHSLHLNINVEGTIQYYNDFIQNAPHDHRLVPECFYAIAKCYLQLQKLELMVRCYDLALKKEKQQLPWFLPYQSNLKFILTNYLKLHSLLKNIPATSSNVCNDQPKNIILPVKHIRPAEPNLETTESKSISETTAVSSNISSNQLTSINLPPQHTLPIDPLTNADRYGITIAHRKWILANNLFSKKVIDNEKTLRNFNTAQLKETFEGNISAMNLVRITFNEMNFNTDHVYTGFYLSVLNVDDVGIAETFIRFLLVDDNFDVKRCSLYNYCTLYGVYEIQRLFEFGSRFTILNPYMHINQDQQPEIVINDPRSLIFTRKPSNDKEFKICRVCLDTDINFILCEACKRVWYCSKECQKVDYQLLQHKLICAPMKY